MATTKSVLITTEDLSLLSKEAQSLFAEFADKEIEVGSNSARGANGVWYCLSMSGSTTFKIYGFKKGEGAREETVSVTNNAAWSKDWNWGDNVLMALTIHNGSEIFRQTWAPWHSRVAAASVFNRVPYVNGM